MHVIKGLGTAFAILILIGFTLVTIYAVYIIGIGLFIVLVIFVLSWIFKAVDT